MLAFVPKVGWLFAVTGLILVLIAIKEISEAAKDRKIFSNYLVAFIMNLVSSVVLIFVGIAAFLGIFGRFLGGSMMFKNFDGKMFNNFDGKIFNNLGNFDGRLLGAGLIVALIVIVVGWAIVIVSSHFTRLSFDGIANRTGVEYFRTAGLLIFIGSFLLIVLGIGALVMFAGVILEIVGFFSLPDKLEIPIIPEITPETPKQ